VELIVDALSSPVDDSKSDTNLLPRAFLGATVR
jgi:hypothetical protein